MTTLPALIFLVLGVGLVLVALQGVSKGWLPNGPEGYKRGKGVSRADQPLGFWFMFLLYFAGGVFATLHALSLLLGGAGLFPSQ